MSEFNIKAYNDILDATERNDLRMVLGKTEDSTTLIFSNWNTFILIEIHTFNEKRAKSI